MTRWAALILLAASHAWAGARSASFSVGGDVERPATWDAASLAALPQHEETLSYTRAGKPVTDTFRGVALWDVLVRAGIRTGAGKNAILGKVVVLTGADGYRVVLSAGELDPRFGHATALVATSDDAGEIAGPGGFARLVIAGDHAGGRFVAGLARVVVEDAP